MARARTNWQRLQNLRAHLAKYSAALDKLQSWENPAASLAAIAGTTMLSFYPHNMLACLLVYIMLHSLFMYRCVVLPRPTSLLTASTRLAVLQPFRGGSANAREQPVILLGGCQPRASTHKALSLHASHLTLLPTPCPDVGWTTQDCTPAGR